MRSVRLVSVWIAFGFAMTAEAAPPTDVEREAASVEETIAKIERVLRPLSEKPQNEWLGGRVSPFDFRISPDEWHRPEHLQMQNLAAYVRTLLHTGVCRADAAALKAIYDIEWRVFGLGLVQMEALYLQRRAELIDLKLPFHERYRRTNKYTHEMSEEPQREMRINFAFDQSRAKDALAFVPRFQRLCR